MREIKLQAWLGHCMVQVTSLNLMKNTKGEYESLSTGYFVKGENNGSHTGFYLESAKIRQFTSLLDRNGMEIYEGDVVNIFGDQELDAGYSFRWDHNAVVKWDENECSFYLDVVKKYQATICQEGFYTVDKFPLRKWNEEEWWIEYKVIGNIYENPELINTDK